jgi:predicted nucleotidyltransferase component of viral defense system
MKYQLLNRREIELINRKTLRYPLAMAEKDYMLAIVSKIIYESFLRDKIVFKGGTAINHCYLSQTRFSEDLDFSSLDKSVTLEEVKEVLGSQDFLEVKEHYLSKATIKVERLKYNGPLGLPNSLKVEIDIFQNVILPIKDLPYLNSWGIETNVKVMDIREIWAEKIRASSDRARYRDFYDLLLLFKKYHFDLEETIELIKQKEIRKPITQDSMLNNWRIAKMEQAPEISQIYYAAKVNNMKIEEMLRKLEINIHLTP